MNKAEEKAAIKCANAYYEDMLRKNGVEAHDLSEIRRNFDFFPETIKKRVRASAKHFPEIYKALPSYRPYSVAESMFLDLNTIPMAGRGYGYELSLRTISLALVQIIGPNSGKRE